ncbi:hypothetical protein HH682_01315 [Rosenbergiella sp. S61]|uniref:Uncharacterized protein n=1 Tax=Rosenbergiella gaditana TaxID=2726987 RepID=A0ABS5SST5_9GAMM|nr:hypothetical protein [Rosenbergiella gaditana]MBT0723099.1 hypothetical protein [Rosenbergiella gaditana]
MDYNIILGVIGGLGIGTMLNSAITSLLNKKTKKDERLYEEKRNAYLGLLSSIHKSAISPSEEASKEYALWQTHCSLFGSKQVVHYSQKIVDTNDGPREERHDAFNKLIESMRNDL